MSRFTVPVLVAAIALAAAFTPGLAHGSDPDVAFLQVTDAPFGFGFFEPTIDGDGSRIAFSGAFDFNGDNPETNFEIFIYDLASDSVIQVTDTPGGFGMFEPLITPDGEHVVFRAGYDFQGTNPDFLFELFEVEVATGQVHQITYNPPGVSVMEPKMSGNAEWIAYRMSGNPLGTNPEHNFEIFRVHRTSGVVEQLTFTTTLLNEQPSISHDGSRVTFMSRTDFDGSNPNGNVEIWIWDEDEGISHVTSTPMLQGSSSPSIDADGRFVAFLSRYDFTGENPDSTEEVYVVDTFSDDVRQLTVPGTLLHLEPVMSPAGQYVVFDSQRDPLGMNEDHNREVFYYDLGRNQLEQLTDTTRGASITQLSERAQTNYATVANDGGTFVIRNEHSLDGRNEGFNLELFCAFMPPPTPDLDGDGDVDGADLGILLAAWGTEDAFSDLNGDGAIDGEDMGLLLASWTS